MKVILNKCFGGFDVSNEAYILYARKRGIQIFGYKQMPDLSYVRFDAHAANRYSAFTEWFTKDFGDNPRRDEIDYGSMLYLNYQHREDPDLIDVVEELGDKASGSFGKLVVVEIPDGLDYVIDDYDGVETLHQKVVEW